MAENDVTEKGMKRGIRDSDVFLLFLTNSMLSRPFCLKEIRWALQMKKPIIIVVERENRFFPFDIERWRRDECTRKQDGTWEQGWLSSSYAQCPDPIKDLIEEYHANGSMIPYRRWVSQSRRGRRRGRERGRGRERERERESLPDSKTDALHSLFFLV